MIDAAKIPSTASPLDVNNDGVVSLKEMFSKKNMGVGPNFGGEYGKKQPYKFFSKNPNETIDIFGGNVKSGFLPDPDFKPGMGTDPEYQAEIAKKKKSELLEKQSQSEQFEKQSQEDLIKINNKKRDFQKKIIEATAKDTSDKSTSDKSDRKKTEGAIEAVFNASKLAKENRSALDAELKALRAKQDKDSKLYSLMNIVAAANDPNRQGSRTQAAVNQLTKEAQGRFETKKSQEETDLAMKYTRAEEDIKRAYAKEDMEYAAIINKKYKGKGAQVEYLNTLLELLNFEDEETKKNFILDLTTGTTAAKAKAEKELRTLFSDATKTSQPEEFRAQLGISQKYYAAGEDLPENTTVGDPKPISNIDLEEALQKTAAYNTGYKTGGRVGYQEGDLVTGEEKEVPMVMTENQLREQLPSFVTNEIVKLIAYSPKAFKDFASITTQADVEVFNRKYDVNLILPNDMQIEQEIEKNETAFSSPVTVPSAVSANQAMMPPQTGTGSSLSPTDVALLSPLEQAIKMRS